MSPSQDAELVEARVQDGTKVDWSRFGVPVTMEVFWHQPSTYALWDGYNNVSIDIDGMSFSDVCTAVKVAVQQLNGARPAYASVGVH